MSTNDVRIVRQLISKSVTERNNRSPFSLSLINCTPSSLQCRLMIIRFLNNLRRASRKVHQKFRSENGRAKLPAFQPSTESSGESFFLTKPWNVVDNRQSGEVKIHMLTSFIITVSFARDFIASSRGRRKRAC